MPAVDSAFPAAGRRVPCARAAGRPLAAAAAAALLAACSSGGGAAQPAATVTATATASPSGAAAGATPPRIIAVTKAGALEVLNPVTGSATATLVPSGVTGDEVAVSATGSIYYTVTRGCTSEIDSLPVSGGSPVQITTGSLPAVSPDGTRLAFASQPDLGKPSCVGAANPVPLYKMMVRTLSSGSQVSYPMVAPGGGSGLPAPISHLSWAPDGTRLAVSLASVQDNEGWSVMLVNTATARYYATGTGVTFVPPTGQPTPRQSYLREGVFLPDGNLFVSRACCGGFPPHNTSRLMWEVTPSGALVHQVAIGFPDLDHVSLDASLNGKWLLYLAGGDLYVSPGGATPHKVTSGLVAAAWATS